MKQADSGRDLIQPRNAIDWLIREAYTHRDDNEFVASLRSQMEAISCKPQELEHTIAALRSAVQQHLGTEIANGPASRCNFCGRSRDKLSALYISAEGAMCDECAVWVLENICREPGQVYLRVSFFMFRMVARLGRICHDVLRRFRIRTVVSERRTH
jgi:hypothetical protein